MDGHEIMNSSTSAKKIQYIVNDIESINSKFKKSIQSDEDLNNKILTTVDA